MSVPRLKESNNFEYENTEVVNNQYGGKIVRNVSIKKGKGYKSISKYHKRKHTGTIRKKLKASEIQMIKLGKFIPGLFNNCKTCSYKKTINNKGGSTRSRKR
jgi:hypothetical protein